jgi:aspartate/methionine/tyrosine aminotransferase
MKIAPFELERYFAKHEFSARYLLSSSDCESLSMSALLAMADADTARLWHELKLGYTESAGHPLLRETIAGVYQEIGVEDILVVVPEEGIFLLMHALLRPSDHIICTFPGYQSLYEVARSIGCEVSRWEPDEARGWHFDVEDLKEKMRANTRLVVVNFPHNPTGYAPPREDFEAIIRLVRERGAYLLSDEMYRFLEIDEGATLPAACERYERAVSLFGLSKTFGLPGLRIGWLASQDAKVLERVSELKDYTTICSSAPSEILAIIALQSRSEIIRRQVERARRNVGVLGSFFNVYRDCFSWNRPIGGSICFPRMLVVDDTSSFCQQLIQATGIMLVPSSQFQYGRRHVRIGFGRDDLPEVLERFGEYLDRRFRCIN